MHRKEKNNSKKIQFLPHLKVRVSLDLQDETPLDAVLRELREEAGILLNDLLLTPKPFVWQYNVFNTKRYVTLSMITYVEDLVEPALMEPEKCEEWRWVDINDALDNYDLFQNLDKTLHFLQHGE